MYSVKFGALEKMKSKSKPSVCVVGAGIIGVTSALEITRRFRDVDVILIADKFSPFTTSDGAAGLWLEYLAGQTPPDKLKKWLKGTYDIFEQTFFNCDAALCGVGQLQGYALYEESHPHYSCQDIVRGFGYLDEDELKKFGENYRSGARLTSYTAESRKLIPYLLKEFIANGGSILKYKIENLRELIGKFDVVVNCTGLAAREVTPDPSVIPIRGQIIRVKAPWVKTFIIDETHCNYIIPNTDVVVLGGTAQRGNYDLNVDSEDANHIWQSCNKLLPNLKHAKIVGEWVGLRPSRFSVRVERETFAKLNGQQKTEVIHNYGHGGSGISISWGCAHEVVELLTDYFKSGGNVYAKL